MIFIFGDSHANMIMKGFECGDIFHNLYQNSVTMHRIGRDGIIPNFNNSFNGENTFIFFYGEVDCRCHIHKQIALGRELNEIIEELTSKYFQTIKNNIKCYKKIIIGSIVPSIRKYEYENVHGPVTHEFPFMGTDEERVLYTKLMNKSLFKKCKEYNFIFLDFYNYYSRPDGTLKYELSDGICHISENKYIIDSLKLLI